MKVKNLVIVMAILFIAITECRHKSNKKLNQKKMKEELKKRLKSKKKWNNYRDLEYKPCELKSGIVGYAIEFTHSLSHEQENKYLVGIKSVGTKVEMSPKYLVVLNTHDLSLEMKRVPM